MGPTFLLTAFELFCLLLCVTLSATAVTSWQQSDFPTNKDMFYLVIITKLFLWGLWRGIALRHQNATLSVGSIDGIDSADTDAMDYIKQLHARDIANLTTTHDTLVASIQSANNLLRANLDHALDENKWLSDTMAEQMRKNAGTSLRPSLTCSKMDSANVMSRARSAPGLPRAEARRAGKAYAREDYPVFCAIVED